jgi:tRNA-specific 2-thiouridylase
MLSGVAPELLERVAFPLGDYTKVEVRELARSAGLAVAEKQESQDLCFMAGTTRTQFLSRHSRVFDQPGEIVDRRGRVLGRHRGHRHFTVGQRRGLGVASSKPLYVLAKDAPRNQVIVGGHDELAVTTVTLSPARLYRDGSSVRRVKLRYRSDPVCCEVEGEATRGAHESLTLTLHDPVHGVAPGQTACLLDENRVLGYGTISHASAERAHRA